MAYMPLDKSKLYLETEKMPKIWDLSQPWGWDTPLWPFPGARSDLQFPRGQYLGRFHKRTMTYTGTLHAGTHMDAPAHMLEGGATLDSLPASHFCGRAVVLDVSDRTSITTEFLQAQGDLLRSVDFVLFYTGWEKKWPSMDFLTDGFAYPTPEAAQYLVDCGLKGVGTDAVSIDAVATETFPAHKVLMKSNLVIVECMCLEQVVGRSDLQLFALPLKYENSDGASVRAVAEVRDFTKKEMA